MKYKTMLEIVGLFIAIVGFIWMLGFPNTITEHKYVYEYNGEHYLTHDPWDHSELYGANYVALLEVTRLDFWNQTAFLLEAIGFVIVLIGQPCEDVEIKL